jgi:hypothetical protein
VLGIQHTEHWNLANTQVFPLEVASVEVEDYLEDELTPEQFIKRFPNYKVEIRYFEAK